MRIILDKAKIAVGAVIISWAMLFLHEVLHLHIPWRMHPYGPLIFLVTAAYLLRSSTLARGVRLSLYAVILLLAIGVFFSSGTRRKTDILEQDWLRKESRLIASTLLAVGEKVRSLEELSLDIGNKVNDFFLWEESFSEGDSLSLRLEAFGELESLSLELREKGRLPEGTQIGIQLFSADGRRIAWAGWPQLVSPMDKKFLSSGKEVVYSRQVSLYRILSHIIPVYDQAGKWRGSVLVDIPLEVNYNVNNKFIKSTSLADNLTSRLSADVSFDYYPPREDLPRLWEDHDRGKPQRDGAGRSFGKDRSGMRHPVEGKPKARGERRKSTLEKGRKASPDSFLTKYPFPPYIEPLSEIAGNKVIGLSGRVLIASVLGNPLLNVTVRGRPFKHFLEEEKTPYSFRAKVCVLGALLVLFVIFFSHFPGKLRARSEAARAASLVFFLVVFRYSLLSFPTAPPGGGAKIFDPVIFATPLLWGLMRSAGDLLITSVFFVVAAYSVLKIARSSAGRRKPGEPGTPRWFYVFKGLSSVGVLYLTFLISRLFVGTVVVNANPRLLGEAVKLFESQVVVLHLGIFLMLTGIFMVGMLGLWGIFRLRGWGDAAKTTVLSAACIVALSPLVGWEFTIIALPLILFVFLSPRYVQREDLVSIVMAAFCFVVIVSGTAYVFLNEEYQGLRKSFVRERVAELASPSDNWKVFILEDILKDFSKDTSIRRSLRNPRSDQTQRLSFDLWAKSSLSLLGYSSAIYILDKGDSVVSRFAIDMPFRIGLASGTERISVPSGSRWKVLDLVRNTPQGVVRFYRGIVDIYELGQGRDGEEGWILLGKVVLDVPFFFENLSWAARTGPRTPEILRNIQEGGIEPRLEEPEALLLARVERGRVVESSTDDLPAGMRLPEEEIQKARSLKWPLLRTHGATYRFMVGGGEEVGKALLAGFRVPSPLWHALRWSTLLSLYLLFAVGIIVSIIFLKRVPPVGDLLPSLTPGTKLGFQQKLLASFLVVALLPTIILAVFSLGVIKERFLQESKREALSKAFSAKKSLVNLLREESSYFLSSVDIDTLLSGGIDESFSPSGDRLVMVIPGEGEGFSGFSVDEVFIARDNGEVYIGAISGPITVVGDEGTREYFIFFGRRLEGEFLGEVAEQVGADVNIYSEGELVSSSRGGLLTGGFISSIMNARAFVKVSLLGVDHALATERAGRYSYQVAYLPLKRIGHMERAAISLPLLFRPESYHVEAQKATSVVFGIFALLFAAIIGLGLILARGIFEPLRGLLEGTRRISLGDLSFRLPAKKRDEIGTVMEAFNEMTDQLKRSQTALEERRRYLEAILANIGTGVISTDPSDRIRTLNNAAEKILGVPREETLGKTPGDLAKAGVLPEFFLVLQESARSREPFLSSEVLIAKGGAKCTIKYMHTKLTFDDRYLGAVFVFEDLTELINSKKLSAWIEMARQIAHEIKNPLTPIKLSTQFMLKAYEADSSDFDRIFKESSETIIHQVEVLKRIAGEFSSFGKMQELHVSSHPLVPLVEEIVSPYRKNASGVEISLQFSSRAVKALTDPEALRKICTNLVENALEAMPQGGELIITCERVTIRGGPFARISFRDTGPGLSDEVKEKLFEPYFSTKTQGTGLGLAICRTLSREMGGDVTVENLPDGRGAVATVVLRTE